MASSTLSTFIRQHHEQLLSDWESFARALPQGSSMDVTALRDHAKAMLDDIATDIASQQTERSQSDRPSSSWDTQCQTQPDAAAEHGQARAGSGFTVIEMISEFRALRSSVVRRWVSQQESFGRAELDDLVRFDEAIDQAIAASLVHYTGEIDETRERFLAILGHDLRNPLSAITMSARFLNEMGGLSPDQARLVSNVESAGSRMSHLVADMLELALSRLSNGMPIQRGDVDAGALLRDVVAEFHASSPHAQIEMRLHGDLTGKWDGARLSQALTNLIGNAIQHGKADTPIVVDIRGDETDAVIAVSNQGAISSEKLEQIRKGMRRGASEGHAPGHLGLGLFIVDRVVEAHGGSVDIQSANGSGTRLTIRLPKSAASAGRHVAGASSNA